MINIKPSTCFTGDNLPILRGINSNSVDLIYLDPPFNSNKSFSAPVGSKAAGASFKDAWTLSDIDQAEHNLLMTGNKTQRNLYHSILAAKHSHSNSMFSYLMFMAPRLIECHRILKETGSIYLHCDPYASHYLKIVLDTIFGRHQFQNEVIWRRKRSQGGTARMVNAVDSILYYSKTASLTYNQQFSKYSKEAITRDYKYEDANGKYRLAQLTASPAQQGGGPTYSFDGWRPKSENVGWLLSRDKLKALASQGRLQWTTKKDGSKSMPYRKLYLKDMPGKAVNNNWIDIPVTRGKERTGYPTQKPLKLLERIIKASSNEGDWVLDPFCGCATTMVAANRLQRKWIGIDISGKAVDLVKDRIREDGGLFGKIIGWDVKDDGLPRRTDLGDELTPTQVKRLKHDLYGDSAGNCLCGNHFPINMFDMDHIVPKANGGTNHKGNYQLLCRGCNSKKGTKSQAEFEAYLKKA